MSDEENIQTAEADLSSGQFEAAREIYGALLETQPTETDFQSGFYGAGYWDNRRETIQGLKPGRSRGSYLYREWDQFQALAEERGYSDCRSYRLIMVRILSVAADELRLAFNREGGRSVDPGLLMELSKCLIKINDYQNAVDILRYTRKLHPKNAGVLFLLGEALCGSGDPELLEKGVSAYRDAFLLNSRAIDPALLAAPPVAEIFRALLEEYEGNLEKTLEWLPARFFAVCFQTDFLPLSSHELIHLEGEANRLERTLDTVTEKYRERVQALLSFYVLILLHHFTRYEKDGGLAREYETLLRKAAPELDEIRKSNGSETLLP